MRKVRAVALITGALLPQAALAHAFVGGLPFDLAFLTGVLAVVTSPWIVLPLLALAIGPGIWSTDRQRPVWLLFLVGAVLAFALSPLLSGPWADLMPLILGIPIAIHAALFRLTWSRFLTPVLGLLMGFTIIVAGFYGYEYGEVQIATQIGYLAAALALLIVPAEIVRTTRRFFPGQVVPILWRIVSSWVAAICVLYLAFSYSL